MDENTHDIESLEGLADPSVARALEGTLKALERDTELLVFVAPGCPVCPHQVRSAATVALASPRVVLDVVDASVERELAAQYEVRGVPTTVVDDELILAGVVPPAQLALRLVERQGPDAAGRVFRTLVAAGRRADAAERLADGRGTEAFIELWNAGTAEQREELRAVAEDALLYDPDALRPVTERLQARLAPGANPEQEVDGAWREDTERLLELVSSSFPDRVSGFGFDSSDHTRAP